MLKQRRENRIVNCLVCWTCHGRMGPNHFELRDMRAYCSLCGSANPLANLRKMSIQEVTTPSEIIVCFTRGGTAAHALHIDAKTALGPLDHIRVRRNARESAPVLACDGWTDRCSSKRHEPMRAGQHSHTISGLSAAFLMNGASL